MGNALPNHSLPNSTPGKAGLADSPTSDGPPGMGEEEEKSVLQAKLTNLAIQIGYGGMAVSLVTVLILSIKFSVDEFYTKGQVDGLIEDFRPPQDAFNPAEYSIDSIITGGTVDFDSTDPNDKIYNPPSLFWFPKTKV